MSTSLDTDVCDALKARKGDWQAIATGSGVSYSWLSKFVNGHIDNPGFGTLTKLHEYLRANPAPDAAAPDAAPAAQPIQLPGPDRRQPSDHCMQSSTSGRDVAALAGVDAKPQEA